VKQQRLPRKGNEREEGRKEGMKEGRRRACYSLDKSRMQGASSVQCSSVQFSPVQFSSVAKFGREEVSNGGEEKCNSPFLVVEAMNKESIQSSNFFWMFFFPLANLVVTQVTIIFASA
jgi:hypothetical protein